MPKPNNSPSDSNESKDDSTQNQEDVEGHDSSKNDSDESTSNENQEKKDDSKEEGDDNPDDEGASDDDNSEESDEEYFSQIGNHKFKTKEDLEIFARKHYGEHSRLLGKSNEKASKAAADILDGGSTDDLGEEAGEDNSASKNKPEPQTAKAQPVKNNYAIKRILQYKSDEFFYENPEALKHKDLIASILRTGTAVNAKGMPDFNKAWEKTLSIIGGDTVKPQSSQKDTSAAKKIMKGGGGSSANSAGGESNKDAGNKGNKNFLQNVWKRKGIV